MRILARLIHIEGVMCMLVVETRMPRAVSTE